MTTPLWSPSAERIANTNLTRFIRRVNANHKTQIADYAGLYEWSIAEPEVFWSELWEFCGVWSERKGGRVLIDGDQMPGAKWFPDARLNFAQNLLSRDD